MFHLAPRSILNTSTSSLSPTSPVLLSSSSPNPDLLSTHFIHCGDPRQDGTSTEFHSSTSSAEAELDAAVKASQEVLGMMSLWKDVGAITRGHVMGDASAAVGIIRRMGLGKVRHLNTSWLWAQDKEASRELQYHKVKKAATTVLTCSQRHHDSIVRHTEAMGCEFVFGRDPVALTVNKLIAKLNMENVARELGAPIQDKWKDGRVDAIGLAQQNLQDHKQRRTELERGCTQSDF